jgi:tetratricopeptide (TPR) repeat protein
MVGVGYLRMYQGRARDAATLARDALEIQRGLGERENIAKTRLLLAYADLPLARAKDAEMELRGALESLRVAGRRDDAAIGEALLANALAAQGRFEDARAAADAANRTLETSENELARVHVLSALGRAQRLMGDNASAARSFELARKEVVRCGFAGMVQNGAPVASAPLYSAGQRN